MLEVEDEGVEGPTREIDVWGLRLFEDPLGFLGEEDGMAGTTALQAGAWAMHLYVKASSAQALLEFSIVFDGPDGENSFRFEGRVGGGQAMFVVEGGVVRRRELGRAVVDIKEDGVELADMRTQRGGDISCFDLHTLVFERVPGQGTERGAIPFDDDNRRVR